MQNLDWNKCFQRVSDAGQHFPPLFPSSGWHVFVFPLVRPPRTTWGGMSTAASLLLGLTRPAEVVEGRYQYQIPGGGGHIMLDSRFAFNAFYMCGATKGDKISACLRPTGRRTSLLCRTLNCEAVQRTRRHIY